MHRLDIPKPSPVKRRGARARLYVFFALVSAIVLSACGADVNTQLNLENDFSGDRQFVMAIEEADTAGLDGGTEAAAAVLEEHAPGALSFEGVETEENGYSASFTMTFAGIEDYQDKITELLDASDIDESDRAMNITVEEEELISSVVFEEDFYNDDLMGWASDALIEEGVVANNTTVFTSSGAASVIFAGEEVETSTSLPRINFSLTDDRRFEEIGLDIEILESGDFNVALSYLISPDSAAEHNQFVTDRVEQLNALEGVESAVEDSGRVDNHDGTNPEPREISAVFSSTEAVEAGMQLVLANDEASFDVEEVADEESPDVFTQYIGTNWECDAICQPENFQQLDGATEYPEHWELVDQQRADGEFYVEFNSGMPIDSFTSTTGLGFTGEMEQTLEFVVSNDTVEGYEDSVSELFAPPENTGSFSTAQRNDTTVYTTAFQAQDAGELEAQVNSYLDDKGITDTVTYDHGSLSGFWPEYELHVDLSAIWELANRGVQDAATFQVDLPPMHSGDSVSATESGSGSLVLEESNGSFVISATGPTMTTVWTIMGILLLVLLSLTIFLWYRHSTRPSLKTSGAGTAAAKPYNIQGPNDPLTETQIYQSPLAPRIAEQDTTETPYAPQEATHIDDRLIQFPDVPVPSATQYQEFVSSTRSQSSSEQPDDNDESSSNDTRAKPSEDTRQNFCAPDDEEDQKE